MTSTSVKIRFEGQFYKPGSLELSSLASLDAFVREFLRTRGVATAATSKLALLFRDATGEWQALHDESDLVAALHDESKITIDVVVLPEQVDGDDDNNNDNNNNDVVEEDTTKTTDETTTTTTTTATAAAAAEPTPASPDEQRKQQCRAACRKRGKRCAVFWLIILGILLFCGFGGGCGRHKRAAEVRFMHVPPSFPQADLARMHELATMQVHEHLGQGAPLSRADRAELTFLGTAAEKMFDENERIGNVGRQLEQELRAKTVEISQLAATIHIYQAQSRQLQQELGNTRAIAENHKHELQRCVDANGQLSQQVNGVQQELHNTCAAAESQAHELQRCAAVNEQLREQLARAVQHASTQQHRREPEAAPDRDSLSHLFLDVSRKLGKLATSQMDELAQKHLGKPLDELLDGTAVRKSLFETLTAFNDKLDNQYQKVTQQQQQQQQQQQEVQRQQLREQERQRQAEERQRHELQEQQREREAQQLLQQQHQREHQRLVQQHEKRLREQQEAEQERHQRLHRQHQREIRRQQEEHESAAKSIAKNLRERAKAAKREMRRFHNEL